MTLIRSLRGSGLACCVLLSGAALALAQPPRPAEVPPGSVEVKVVTPPARDVEVRRASTLMGARVSIDGGLAVGKVDDIVFNEDGYVDYLVVVNEGKYVLVPWSAAKVDVPQHTVQVNIVKEKFQEVPTFTRDKWPNVYEPQYQQKIYEYYNVRPSRDRRIDRREDRRP